MKFADVIGHNDIKQKLVSTVKESRISHAQLFLGPQGSGNLALAIAFAQYINCTGKRDGDSCGVCPSCVKYEKLIHPDLHFIFPTASAKGIDKPTSNDFIAEWREYLFASNFFPTVTGWQQALGIERKQTIINARDSNEIIKILSYKSYESEYKVMIIWMVEKIYHAAAPKILKILEEPPDKTLFLLVSENQDLILNTILSRTQLVKIGSIKEDDLIKALIDEGYKPNIVHNAVRITGGDYIAAKRFLQNSEEERFNFEHFKKWMRSCYQFNIEQLTDLSAKLGKNSREQNKNLLKYVLRITRECLLMNYGRDELVRLSDDEAAFLEKFHPFINERNSYLIFEEIEKSINHIDRNANANLLFLDLSLKFAKWLRM